MSGAEEEKLFVEFEDYPWETDHDFQAGVKNILRNNPSNNEKARSQCNENTMTLLRAKHFYFSTRVIKKPFDLERYLEFQKRRAAAEDSVFTRLEKYDFDNDKKYAQGLSILIQGWAEGDTDGISKTWDKFKLDREFAKAKAFYYSSCIEPVNVGSYLQWRKNKKSPDTPKCPFATLWENKKGAAARLVSSPVIGHFTQVEKKAGLGPSAVALSSPCSTNTLSIARLDELMDIIKHAEEDTSTTALLISAIVEDDNTFDITGNSDVPIETRDTRVFTSGPAYNETASQVNGDIEMLKESLKKLSDAYHDFTKYLYEIKKPTITILNGEISANSIYLSSSPHFLRVVNEHALVQLGLQLSHSPIPPLSMLSMIRSRGAPLRPIPAGLELYLALADPESVRLRAPELLKIGLADVFIPENHLNDFYENTKRLAVCPAPYTASAVQLALSGYHSYPGPDRIGVWESEIEQVFGDVKDLETLIHRLTDNTSKWSRATLKHWSTLPPTLLKVTFLAMQKCKDWSPLEALTLEQTLNTQWRQTEDYKQWKEGKCGWSGSLESTETDELVSFYFEKQEEPTTERSVGTFVYVVPKELPGEDAIAQAKCPVTGHTGVCPVKD